MTRKIVIEIDEIRFAADLPADAAALGRQIAPAVEQALERMRRDQGPRRSDAPMQALGTEISTRIQATPAARILRGEP